MRVIATMEKTQIRALSFEEIPIFKRMDQASRKLLPDHLEKQEYIQGEKIITAGNEVKGIYILCAGRIGIFLPDYDHPVADQGPGSAFGEMALIEGDSKASADVVVSSESAVTLFCPKVKFNQLLEENPLFAKGFYQSASLMLSTRLRQTNEKVVREVGRAIKIMDQMFDESGLVNKIKQTQGELDEAGGSIMGKLMHVIPLIERIADEAPEIGSLSLDLKHKIEDVFLIESQKFDRISQEMNLLMQYFENLKIVASGGEPKKIKGDKNLFKD